MAINLSQFTVPNGAITDLRELMLEALFNDPDIERIITTRTGVVNGDKFGYLYNLGDLGEDRGGCDPTYTNINITGNEKSWDLGDWEISKKICYTQIEKTIAEYCAKTGTEEADLTGTVFIDDILAPLMERSMLDMLWRIVFFGDKAAKNIANGGNLTAGVDPKLFTMCDGLFKRLRAITTANAKQLTPIAANTDKGGGESVTYASQMAAIKQDGAAIAVVDDLLQNADSRIFDFGDSAIYMTSSLFKALRNDVKKLHNLQLSVENVKSGINLSEYDGVPIIALDIWDRMIRKYEDNGTALNAPHRAVFTSPQNLWAGTNDKKMLSELSVIFDGISRNNYIYAKSKIDTNVRVDELVQIAM